MYQNRQVPEQAEQNVRAAPVVELLKIFEDFFGTVLGEERLAGLILSADGRQENLRRGVVFDSVDGGTEPQEHAERRELSLEGHRSEFVLGASVDPVRVEVTPRHVVHVVDVLLLAPLDERAEPIPV